MKSPSLILSLCVASVYAGVIPWTKEGEDEALSLWREYCSGQSERGVDESRDVDWFCKRSPDGGRQLVYPHKIDLGLKRENKKQVVFIETPGDHYRHDITVSGHLEANHKTNIVVIPATDTHTVDVKKDISVNVDGEKPAIFFARNSPDAIDENIDSQPTLPAARPPPPPQRELYQVPPKKFITRRRVKTHADTINDSEIEDDSGN